MIWFLATSSCTVEKSDIDLKIANEKSRLFLSMLLITGFNKLSEHKMYWEAAPDTFAEVRSNSMPRNTFECILQNLHLCDKEQLDK